MYNKKLPDTVAEAGAIDLRAPLDTTGEISGADTFFGGENVLWLQLNKT